MKNIITQQPRRNHFISKYRLKYFAASNEKILCYDKKEKRCRKQHIKNTAVIRNHNYADPIDIKKLTLDALNEEKRKLESQMQEATSLDYRLIYPVYTQLNYAEEIFRQSFNSFYKPNGIDKTLSDSYGFEKIFACMEGEMAKILKKIDSPNSKITQQELQSFMFGETFLSLNNPKFREQPDREQITFYSPFAKIGEVVTPLLDKIKKYRFRIISYDYDMFVMGDFPILFTQKNKKGDMYIRSPYNFARMPEDVEFILYMPVTPSKVIVGFLPPTSLKLDKKSVMNFVFGFNGYMWDFANRFVYAKNEEALKIAKYKSGVSIPAEKYYVNNSL